MLAKREAAPQSEDGEPQPEEEPGDRWSLVNAITSYALKSYGLVPYKRNFLVGTYDEDEIRIMLSEQYPTIDFANMPLEIYPLRLGEPTELDYYPRPKPHIIEVPANYEVI